MDAKDSDSRNPYEKGSYMYFYAMEVLEAFPDISEKELEKKARRVAHQEYELKNGFSFLDLKDKYKQQLLEASSKLREIAIDYPGVIRFLTLLASHFSTDLRKYQNVEVRIVYFRSKIRENHEQLRMVPTNKEFYHTYRAFDFFRRRMLMFAVRFVRYVMDEEACVDEPCVDDDDEEEEEKPKIEFL
eukprot:m.228711 g.228711  ORF g.228711 m.228711 type:complete len:187 (-) comp17051_c0_seq46:370-930(-)